MGDSHYLIQTKPGEQRTVTLADGSVVALNGGTTLRLDRKDPRSAELSGGEAFFTVVHHADRPFEVKSGDVVLRDIGTRFAVSRIGGAMDVKVAEGSVQFQPHGARVTLTKGMMLSYNDASAHATVAQIAAENVAGWTRGELDFTGTPMAVAAAELSRTIGAPIQVAAEMADKPFTGTLHVKPASAKTIAKFAELNGATAFRDGPGWRIAPQSERVR
nr:FecR domain-containing protein [Sphingomonas vulcanisoli]